MEQRSLTHGQLLAFLQGARGSTPRCQYESPKYVLSITNTANCCLFPHKSQAACVLLVVSAARRDFEASWKLLQQQISLACKLHVRQLVVCVNKMDATDPPYNGRRYQSIVRKVSVHLQGLGSNPNDVVFLPISAVCGDNMQGASQEVPWFGGWEIREEAGGTLRGMTLRQLLDGVVLSHKLDSCSTVGDWSPQEEKILLLAWRAMASPASRTPPCPHVLSAALLCAGVRRSPEQCRSKANLLLNSYIAARLQGRQSTGAFCDVSEELEAVLDHEATQCVLQMGGMELTGRACGASQASAPLEEEEPATPCPPLLPELLLAGEALGAEKGPGVRSERPQRSPGGRGGDPPAQPQCLRRPSSWRDQDPDCLITGLEIKPCERTACPGGSRAEEEAALGEGYRCVVLRTAYFAVKQKRAETAVRPRPWLAGPTPLLEAPPLHPPTAQCPPLPPTPEVCRLVPPPLPPASPAPAQWGPPPPLPPPLSLAEPLLWVDGPGLAPPTARPAPALLPLLDTQVSLCSAPSGSLANALPWQYQQAHAYVPLEPVGPWPSSCEPAPPGDSSPPVQLGPPAAAAAALAILLTQGAPEPWETEEDPPEPPSAAEGSEPPSPGTPASPLLPEAPRGSCLGLSAATLLSSLARLDPGEDLRVACPPGTPLQPLSLTRSADSGTPPSPQLQGLLSSSGLPSSSWPQRCPGDS